MNILEEVLKSSIFAICGLGVATFGSMVGGMVKMFLDLRDLKKDLRAAFCKIRELEKK